jgi:hypothetical protein
MSSAILIFLAAKEPKEHKEGDLWSFETDDRRTSSRKNGVIKIGHGFGVSVFHLFPGNGGVVLEPMSSPGNPWIDLREFRLSGAVDETPLADVLRQKGGGIGRLKMASKWQGLCS